MKTQQPTRLYLAETSRVALERGKYLKTRDSIREPQKNNIGEFILDLRKRNL